MHVLIFVDLKGSIHAQKFKDVEIIVNQLNNGNFRLIGKGRKYRLIGW